MKPTTFLSMMILTVISIMTAGVTNAMNTISVSDQGRIYGRISEFITGQLLDLVSVELFSSIDSTLVVGTVTNNKGEFSFSMLKPGEYFLVVSLKGFITKQIAPVNIRQDESKVGTGEIQLNRIPRKPAKNRSAKHATYARSTMQSISYNH
jgi:hypothetical protein